MNESTKSHHSREDGCQTRRVWGHMIKRRVTTSDVRILFLYICAIQGGVRSLGRKEMINGVCNFTLPYNLSLLKN